MGEKMIAEKGEKGPFICKGAILAYMLVILPGQRSLPQPTNTNKVFIFKTKKRQARGVGTWGLRYGEILCMRKGIGASPRYRILSCIHGQVILERGAHR